MVDADSKFRKLFKGGGIVALGIVFEVAISFVAKLLIARLFKPVEYGGLSLGITMMAMVSTVSLLGVNSGIGRFLPRSESASERRGIIVSGFMIAVPSSIAAGAVLALLSPWIASELFGNPGLKDVLLIFALTIPIAGTMKMTIGCIQGLQQSLPKTYIQHITLPVIRFFGIVAVLIMGTGVMGVAIAYSVSYAAAMALGLYFVGTRTSLFSVGSQYIRSHRRLLTYSLPLTISTMMSLVFSDIDTFMLGFYRGTFEVGVYNVAYPLAQLLIVSLAGFKFAFLPIISELHSENNLREMNMMYETATKWVSLLTLPALCIFILYPDVVISTTFGANYASGSTALSVLSLGFFVHVMLGFNGATLSAVGRTRRVMYANIFTSIINITMNILLIPEFGVLGAAVATTVSYFVLNILLSYQTYSILGISPVSNRTINPVFAGLITASILYIAVTILLENKQIELAFFIVALALVYPVALARSGAIEQEEVMLVRSFEERAGIDLSPVKNVLIRFLL